MTTQNEGSRLGLPRPKTASSSHEVNDLVAIAQSTIDRIAPEPEEASADFDGVWWDCDACQQPIANGEGIIAARLHPTGKWQKEQWEALHLNDHCGGTAPNKLRIPIEPAREYVVLLDLTAALRVYGFHAGDWVEFLLDHNAARLPEGWLG